MVHYMLTKKKIMNDRIVLKIELVKMQRYACFNAVEIFLAIVGVSVFFGGVFIEPTNSLLFKLEFFADESDFVWRREKSDLNSPERGLQILRYNVSKASTNTVLRYTATHTHINIFN